MMPSSRVDMFVTYRDANGVVAPAPTGATATLTMVGLSMGSGDKWPSVNMAKVLFNQTGQTETKYRRSITYLPLPETAACSPTDPTR